MEEKKVKVGSVVVGICLCIIVILLILIVLFFYNSNIEKNNLQEKITELETIIEEKDNQKADLSENSSEVENDITEENIVNNKEEVKGIELTYDESDDDMLVRYSYPKFCYGGFGEEENIDNWEDACFVFKENGEFTYSDYQSVFEGKYEIVNNNEIKCDFKTYWSESGGYHEEEFDLDTTLTIISNDKIIGSTLEKRYKTTEDGRDEFVGFYWGVQKVVYELNK